MKTRSAKRKSCGPPSLALSAVIICDDLVFRANAAATLERLGLRDEVNVRWKTIFWPINALNEKELAKKALVDSLDAHLILFPARCAHSLPHWVFDWLSRWVELRTIRDAALGIMADEHAAEFPKLTPLIRFARMHDLTVIVDQQRVLELAAPDLTGVAPSPACQRFGINE